MPDNVYLKTCPLCGNPAVLLKKRMDTGQEFRDKIKPYFARLKGDEKVSTIIVYCASCTFCHLRSAFFPSPAEATTSWNMRFDDKAKRGRFPSGPYKYYRKEGAGEYALAVTNAKMEVKRHLCDIQMDSSIKAGGAEAIMRLLTASRAMYKNLYYVTAHLPLLIDHIEKTNKEAKESGGVVFGLKQIKRIQSEIQLLLAEIEGEPVTFDPTLDTPELRDQHYLPQIDTTASKPAKSRPVLKPIKQPHPITPKILSSDDRKEE